MNNEKNCQDCVWFYDTPQINYCKRIRIAGDSPSVQFERTTGDCGKEGKNFIPKSEPKDEWD